MHLGSLQESGKTPYEVIDGLLKHPHVGKLLKGAVPLEYSSHLIPEGGIKGMSRLYTDGMLVVGDAAGLCYTNGLNLEGINLAMTSGSLPPIPPSKRLNPETTAQGRSLCKRKSCMTASS
jgi:electron transfer flavoprotein-quinone oxidoreductase